MAADKLNKKYILDLKEKTTSKYLLHAVKLEKQNGNEKNIKNIDEKIKIIEKALRLEFELEEIARVYNMSIIDYSKQSIKEDYKLNIITDELKEKANTLANNIINKTKEVEPYITKELTKLESDSLFLVGLNTKIKTKESIVRKIINKYIKLIKENKDINNINIDIKDCNRYTFVSNFDQYKENIVKTLNYLENKQYKILNIKNKWGEKDYQGINVNLKTPYNTIMEIQFHTIDSYIIKENLTHPYYELTRNNFIPKYCHDVAKQIQELYQSLLVVPKDIEKFKYKK